MNPPNEHLTFEEALQFGVICVRRYSPVTYRRFPEDVRQTCALAVLKILRAALRAANYERLQCEACRRWISRNAMGRHQAACKPVPEAPAPEIYEGQNRCGCGRAKRREADCCFGCEEKTDDFARIDAALARHR